nr:MAG TPA: hypothetical protein [Caudoviricetes sp.]DAU57588.1 MAG TPA: hypothetical protein [Caudoviricetes sp.]DAY19963.1 MAG TPA: hypothetical protein [Caudoviricetes sp.]
MTVASGKCKHFPDFFIYRADVVNFCRFVCTKGRVIQNY